MKNMREKFEAYLIARGYKTETPTGKPSTVGDYLHRVDWVCENEHMTYETLMLNIDRIVSAYDAGGEKEQLGKTSHRAVINALRRFQEFTREEQSGDR